MTRKRILSISYTPLATDARVQRQLRILSEFGHVTTVGYGPALPYVDDHIEVRKGAHSLPATIPGVTRLALRRHRGIELKAPGERSVIDEIDAKPAWDLVVANDARALPTAFRAARGAPVWADMHEWAPEENAASRVWMLLVGPYMDALCRRYLPRAAAVTTVGNELARLYAARYGIEPPRVVRNAGPFQELKPSATVAGQVRLVHSGIAVPERNIESLIDAVRELDERFTLDLYLIGTPGFLKRLQDRARGCDRVRFREPVATSDLPATLNAYDLGVYLLPIRSINHRHMLPNKFFDFVQARIGMVFGPSEETNRLITDHGLGVVTPGWHASHLVEALQALTPDHIRGFKEAADRAARELSSEADQAVQRDIVARLLEGA